MEEVLQMENPKASQAGSYHSRAAPQYTESGLFQSCLAANLKGHH